MTVRDERREDRGPEARREAIHPWRWALVALWIVVFSTAVIYILHDINTGRVKSCRATYRSIEEVALFFFPPPQLRTPRQIQVGKDLHLFITAKIANCPKQVNP